MKIEINDSMKNLLQKFNFSLINENISKYPNLIEQNIFNGVFEESEDYMNSFGDFISPKELQGKNNTLNLGIKYFFRSVRLDDLYYKFPSTSELHFLTGFVIIGIWLSNIKKIYPKDSFIFLVQYDKGSDGSDGYSIVSPGFFIKCYLKKDFIRIYKTKTIKVLREAHMSIEV